ncbi:putative zinc finger protein [Orchesella cincta]|uniref:Putative zinc finger protein n=1 Tax=Orchesella cincta TaxID=48709 RepID=A0A1D2MUS1_ORCCI|nr:putative zinc finger protein [Orchesella cincta]
MHVVKGSKFSGERPYVCSIRLCGKKFVSNGAKTAHEKTHDSSRREGEPKYKCDLCDRKYHLLLSLRCHQARHKKGLNFRTKPDPSAPKKVYPRNKPTPCPIPKELTAPPTKRSGFRKWLKGKVNNKEDTENTGDGSPKAKAGRSKKAKQLGRRARNLARSKECSECAKKFSTAMLLRLHMRVHTGETPHECEICHRIIKNKSKHMKIHDPNRFQGEKKHICDQCPKAFYLQHTLYNHRKFAHPGVVRSDAGGPSACPICGKIIHYKLKKHMARHSEATKIHKCEVCERPFFTTAEAKNHAVHYHNPDKLLRLLFKIKCPACPPEYFGHPSKRAVKIHWLEHHKDKPMPAEYRKSRYNISAYNKKGRFECPHCPETKRPVYSQKVSLKRHVSKQHPDKVEVRKKSENSCKRRNNPKKKNMETDDEEESTSSGSSSSEEEDLNLDDDESDNDKAPKDVKRSPRIRSKKIAISARRRNPIKKVKPVETSNSPPQMGNKHVKIQLKRVEDDTDLCEQYDVLEQLDRLPYVKREVIIYKL